MSLFSKKSKVQLSIPLEEELHGIKIRKLKVGEYIRATETLKNIPAALLADIFPGKELDEILGALQTLNKSSLLDIAGKLMMSAPKQLLVFISSLINEPIEKLEDLSLNELFDVLYAFWKVNDLTDFMQKLKRTVIPALMKLISAKTANV